MTDVKGHGLTTGLSGMIVSVAWSGRMLSVSVCSGAGTMVSVVDVASCFRDWRLPCFPLDLFDNEM